MGEIEKNIKKRVENGLLESQWLKFEEEEKLRGHLQYN